MLWLFTSKAFSFCDHFEKSWVNDKLSHDWSHWENKSEDWSWEDLIEGIRWKDRSRDRADTRCEFSSIYSFDTSLIW